MRDFPEALEIPVNEAGAEVCETVVDTNLTEGVTWLHSYVSPDKKQSWCVYDAPTPEAVRRAATRNRLPVTQIMEVRVLDPYFYTGEAE
jgi:hypothetical protein